MTRTPLMDAIDAFLAKYPPEVELEHHPRARRRAEAAIRTWAEDLTAAAERHARNNPTSKEQKP